MITAITSMADAQKLASTGRIIEDTIALGELARLEGLLVEPFGSVKYKLVFSTDVVGRACVRVKFKGSARLLCQRSLEGFDFPLDYDAMLGFIAKEDEESSLMPNCDPILITHDTIEFISLVEDELILLIPPVPVNPALADAQSPGVWQAKAPEKTNPFASLSSLLKGKPNEKQ
jgi:uncharacterized protein